MPLLLAAGLLSACTQSPTTPREGGRVRVLAALTDQTLQLDVALEGQSGAALNGAYVSVQNPGGSLTPLTWNAARNTYTLTAPSSGGTYRVRVDSAALGVRDVSVPVTSLQGTPHIQDVTDSAGHSVRNFERVTASTPIAVTWAAVSGAQRYQTEVRQNGQLVLTLNSTDPAAVIPAGTLAGSVAGVNTSVRVTAAAQSGDPAYQSAPFLATSSVTSLTLAFQVIP